MPKIEIKTFFYDLIHCKDKIFETFDKWDKKYDEDERGPLVAGMRECKDAELITLLMNIQKLLHLLMPVKCTIFLKKIVVKI